LQNASLLNGPPFTMAYRYSLSAGADRADIVDFTVGLHAELADRTLCRVGGVFPLGTGANRCFDGELQVQLERRF